MKQVIVKPRDLRKFMSADKYEDFIAYLQKTRNIPVNTPIFLLAEWSEGIES